VSCFRPLQGSRNPESGEVWIGTDPTRSGRSLELQCGRCIGCMLDRSRAWAVRIMHEAQRYDRSWMATFTYDDKALPEDGSLKYEDFQDMMRRLRERIRSRGRIRFFCSGEYGSIRRRPHFHAILFNTQFGDEQELFNGSFRSSVAESVWKKGTVQLDDVTVASAAYVAGYVVEKATKRSGWARARALIRRKAKAGFDVGDALLQIAKEEEFVRMSLKPGIGAHWYERFKGDLFPVDYAVSRDGQRYKVPRYYWERYRREADAMSVELIEEGRFRRAELRKEDSTRERLAVREEVAIRKVECRGDL